ncbi:hypothetical protein MKX01_026602 [Papaver californicum]|nr:hypothetical protein MKX01_026602 [Papaver californicum]
MFPADAYRISTAITDMKCNYGEKYVTFNTLVCICCHSLCLGHCPEGSSVTKANCDLIRFLASPMCECCRKALSPPPHHPHHHHHHHHRHHTHHHHHHHLPHHHHHLHHHPTPFQMH